MNFIIRRRTRIVNMFKYLFFGNFEAGARRIC